VNGGGVLEEIKGVGLDRIVVTVTVTVR
jgi:hypothetical protein